jgi:hypothetical protein
LKFEDHFLDIKTATNINYAIPSEKKDKEDFRGMRREKKCATAFE